MKLKEAIDIIEEIAPLELGEPWDNNSIQLKVNDNEVERVIFTLEINDDVIDEAIALECDLIVTHHPLIFNAIKKIDMDDIVGRYIVKLVKSGINVYSTHTNFDKASMGNNFYMADLLNLRNVEEVENSIGIIGEFNNPMTFDKVIAHVEDRLDLPDGYIRSVGNFDKIIKSVALCTGAGGDLIYDAKNMGADLVITGDVKFNIAQDAKAMNLALIDAGHYGTEKIFSENIKEQFEILAKEKGFYVETLVAKANTNPFNL